MHGAYLLHETTLFNQKSWKTLKSIRKLCVFVKNQQSCKVNKVFVKFFFVIHKLKS